MSNHFYCDLIQVSLRDHFAKDAIQRQTHCAVPFFFVIFSNNFFLKYCVILLAWFLTSQLQLLKTGFKKMSATFWPDAEVRSLNILAWTFVAVRFYTFGVSAVSVLVWTPNFSWSWPDNVLQLEVNTYFRPHVMACCCASQLHHWLIKNFSYPRLKYKKKKFSLF